MASVRFNDQVQRLRAFAQYFATPHQGESHREFSAKLDCHFNFSNLFATKLFLNYGKILPNCVLYVFNRLDVSSPLRPATGQARHGNGKTFFRLVNGNAIAHMASIKISVYAWSLFDAQRLT